MTRARKRARKRVRKRVGLCVGCFGIIGIIYAKSIIKHNYQLVA